MIISTFDYKALNRSREVGYLANNHIINYSVLDAINMNNYIEIIKYTNCRGKNNNGHPVTKYAGVTRMERMSNDTFSKVFNWLPKGLAMQYVENGIPFIVDSMEMQL